MSVSPANRQRRRQEQPVSDERKLRSTIHDVNENARHILAILADRGTLYGIELEPQLAAVQRFMDQRLKPTDYPMLHAMSEATRDNFVKGITLESAMLHNRVIALVTQERAYAQLDKLFKDDETAAIFVEHIKQFAQTPPGGFEEYPGLLELVATYTYQQGTESTLKAAVKQQLSDVGAHASDFIAHQINGGAGEHRAKELAALFDSMHLFIDEIAVKTSVPETEIYGWFVGRLPGASDKGRIAVKTRIVYDLIPTADG
jgi:hypothetical protein